jgi:HD-like signal output (HDOD) protein
MEIRQMLSEHDPEKGLVSAHDVACVIEKDIGIAGKVLKMANSVYYKRSYGEIGDIATAVTRIGLDELCRTCMALGMIRLFPDPSPLVPIGDFWKHSIAVAMASRSIAKRCSTGIEDVDSLYTAGLLHDVGILLLDKYFPDEYGMLRSNDSGNLFDREREILGIDVHKLAPPARPGGRPVPFFHPGSSYRRLFVFGPGALGAGQSIAGFG